MKKTTITSICQEALISRNTFYIHYPSIDDLVQSLYHDLEQNFLNSIPPLSLIDECTKWYIDDRYIVNSLFKCPSLKFNHLIFEIVIRKPNINYIHNFDKIISDIRIKLNIEYMLNAMLSYTQCWLEHYNEISKEQVYKDLYDLCKEPTLLFHQKIKQVQSK